VVAAWDFTSSIVDAVFFRKLGDFANSFHLDVASIALGIMHRRITPMSIQFQIGKYGGRCIAGLLTSLMLGGYGCTTSQPNKRTAGESEARTSAVDEHGADGTKDRALTATREGDEASYSMWDIRTHIRRQHQTTGEWSPIDRTGQVRARSAEEAREIAKRDFCYGPTPPWVVLGCEVTQVTKVEK
jgi:hypothetical protein